MRRLFGAMICAVLPLLLPLRASGLSLVEPIYQEATPFLAQYRHAGALGQDMGCLYSLDAEGQNILAYAVTPGAEPVAGVYSVENLEDHNEIAGRLRAVVLMGYPAVSLSQLTKEANPWLLGQGYAPLCQLQSGEALLATQLTLWHLAGGCQIRQCYSGWKDLSTAGWSSFRSQVRARESLYQQETEYTATNIQGLQAYLESLSPIEAGRKVMTSGDLAQTRYQVTQTSRGDWEVSVDIFLDCQIEEGDCLTLRVQCGEETWEQPLTQPGAYPVSFSGLSKAEPVTVTVFGTQQEAGAYFFQNGDSRLLGYAQGDIPIQAQVTLTPDRILHLYKTTPEPEGSQPLANIQFNIYLAATRDQLERREVRLSTVPTAQEVEACQNPQSLVAILSTDEQGMAGYNFTAGGDPDGVYLVVEQYSPATAGPVEPFYITVPGDDLEIHLENQGEALPELTLEVSGGNDCVGSELLWQLTATLPAGLGNGKTFVLTDTFPTGLDWDGGSMAVSITAPGEEPVNLVEGIHYLREWGPEQFTISLTLAGMAFGAAGEGEKQLSITFLGAVNRQAALGKPIVNRARLEYENAAGIRFSQTAEAPPLTISAIHVTQTDGSGQPILGARYALARPARPGEDETETLTISGEAVTVTWVSFWQTPDLSASPVTEAAAEVDGVWFYGLGQGDYYLVELRSAPGYRSGEPIAVTLTEEITQLTVQPSFLLPDTGSIGVLGLTALGILSLTGAFWLIWQNRREGA